MSSKKTHWTNESLASFLYSVAADFADAIQQRMDDVGLSQKRLARKLQISDGRVSQLIHNPANITLYTMVKWVRALGLKIAIVVYDDDDPKNEQGPINAGVFRVCWRRRGKPRDFHGFTKKERSGPLG